MAYQEGYLPTEAELQNAIKISLAAADGSLWANSATDEYGQLSQQTEFAQEINTAARTISAYAMNGGDVSKIPQSLQYLASTDWANRIDAAGSGKWRDVLPLLAVAGGGLAGVFGGAAAAGGAAAGTEGAATYGAAGEFAGGAAAGGTGTAGAAAGGATLAEQSAAIGSGSAAGTAAGTGVGTGTAAGTTVTGAGTAGTAASGTGLSRILNGTATTEDGVMPCSSCKAIPPTSYSAGSGRKRIGWPVTAGLLRTTQPLLLPRRMPLHRRRMSTTLSAAESLTCSRRGAIARSPIS